MGPAVNSGSGPLGISRQLQYHSTQTFLSQTFPQVHTIGISTYRMADKAPGAGHESAPVAISWLKRDVLLFAASIGATADELHYLYVSNGIRPPPS